MHPMITMINENWDKLPMDGSAESMMEKHDAILDDESHPDHEYAAFCNFHMTNLLQSCDRLTTLLREFASVEEISAKAKEVLDEEPGS